VPKSETNGRPHPLARSVDPEDSGRTNVGCAFNHGEAENIAAWKVSAVQLAADRWLYTSPSIQRFVCPDVFKTAWSAMSFFGCRPACPEDSAPDVVAKASRITTAQVFELWAYAEDLATTPKTGVSSGVDHYVLAMTGRPALFRSISTCAFDVEAVVRPSNMRALANSRKTDPCWMIDERLESRLDDVGVICVMDPEVVLLVLRSTATSLVQLATEFFEQGIPFLMPRRATHVERIGHSDTASYRVEQEVVGQLRSVDHAFNVDDYMGSRSIFRYAISADSRVGRLALLSGGCPWRLARPLRNVGTILSGPSGHAASGDPELSLCFQYQGATLVEDRLLNSEMCMIVGEVQVSGGNKEDHRSFFPSLEAWFNSGYGHLGWNEVSEEFLRTLDAQYRTFTTVDPGRRQMSQPILSTRWPEVLGDSFDTRGIHALMRDDAVQFLAQC
jgi:hypothetical protein